MKLTKRSKLLKLLVKSSLVFKDFAANALCNDKSFYPATAKEDNDRVNFASATLFVHDRKKTGQFTPVDLEIVVGTYNTRRIEIRYWLKPDGTIESADYTEHIKDKCVCKESYPIVKKEEA